MPIEFVSLDALRNAGFDAVIDVRSPSEFENDHIPGAINLPVLSDEERAHVGTIYVQDCAFKARKIGAALVAKNAAYHLENSLAEMDGAWRPLIYCWRGGQRSGSFASILKQIGWRAETLAGGYQAYRRQVVRLLYENEFPFHIILLDGNTGSAKTDLLAKLPEFGVPVLDLEGFANHRGSVLGGQGGQPSQKAFESRIVDGLCGLSPDATLVVEAESSKIGDINLPSSLWNAMQSAPRIKVTATLDERAAYLVRAYSELIANPDELASRLEQLRKLRGHERVDHWQSLIVEKEFVALAKELIEFHYDPAYSKSRASKRVIATVAAQSLDTAGQRHLAERISHLVTENSTVPDPVV